MEYPNGNHKLSEPNPHHVTQDQQGNTISPAHVSSALPTQIARYPIERVLGNGGLCDVYLASDEQHNRRVSIKAPHARRLRSRKTRNCICPRLCTMPTGRDWYIVTSGNVSIHGEITEIDVSLQSIM